MGPGGLISRREPDKAGDAARAAGKAGISVASRAKELNDKHHMTEKVVDISKGAWAVAVAKATEIEHKHHVTHLVAEGISRGFGKFSEAVFPGQVRCLQPSRP